MEPWALRNAATFEKAREITDVLDASTDADEIGEAIEAAASDPDLANAVIFYLLCKTRGWDEQRTGVEMAAIQPTVTDIWTPTR